jgi:exodeoxyribonuclease-3
MAFIQNRFTPYLKKIQQDGRQYIICGDMNIVHKEIDIKNFNGNKNRSGCLPEERAWMDELFNEVGFIDAFREINQEPHQYTWWSNRGQSWANNTGWRIDYQILSANLKGTAKSAYVYKDKRFSDHAPLILEYQLCN